MRKTISKKIIGIGFAILPFAMSIGSLKALADNSILPLQNIGHGVVCTQKACTITFNKKVSYISIYRWKCEKQNTQCQSAFFIDLHGKYKNTPAFAVVNHNPNGFLYKVSSASRYSKNEGRRRFVIEFRTKKLPIVVYDFNSSSIEVLKTGRIVRPHKDKMATQIKSVKPVKSAKPVKVVEPKIKTAEIPKDTAKQEGKNLNRQHAAPTSVVAKKEKKKNQSSVVVIKNTKTGEKTIYPQLQQQAGNRRKRIVIDLNRADKHKKPLNQKATVKTGQLAKTQAKSKKKKLLTAPKMITLEQMGDEMLKQHKYTSAIGWYELALKGTKDNLDRKRLQSKIDFVLNEIKGH